MALFSRSEDTTEKDTKDVARKASDVKDKKPAASSTFSKQDRAASNAPAETIIGASVSLEGDINSDGPVTVHGTVRGSVSTKQTLTVGETARILASVSAKTVVVAGTIEGAVTATDRVELESTGVVKGDVTTKILSVNEGATINGQLSMGSDTARKA